jgi:hypothetical protein
MTTMGGALLVAVLSTHTDGGASEQATGSWSAQVEAQARDLPGPVLLVPREDVPSQGHFDEVAKVIGQLGKAFTARRQALVVPAERTEAEAAVSLCQSQAFGAVVIVETSTASAETRGTPLTAYRCPAQPAGSATIATAADGRSNASPGTATRYAVGGVVGFGTPVGNVGVEGTYAVMPWIDMSIGAGLSTFLAPGFHIGPQIAAMPRLHWGSERWGLGLGAGASFGRHGWWENWIPDTCKDECAFKTGWVGWGNAEVAIERRLPTGRLRMFVGGAVPLNPDAVACNDAFGSTSYNHCLVGHADDGKSATVYVGVSMTAFLRTMTARNRR